MHGWVFVMAKQKLLCMRPARPRGERRGRPPPLPLSSLSCATLASCFVAPPTVRHIVCSYRCGVASTGVAAGGELHATVYPLILRGVRLLGVDSTLPWCVDEIKS